MADVTLRHVYKVYEGSVRAVNDFDLQIKDKEFVVFVGPSGCGKSTTLRMIAGLEDITAGQLYIDGELMNEVEPKNRDIAMVFQSYALYPHMTVYENMAFGLKLRHTPKEEIDQRVKAAAEILEISELLSRKPKALSGGQRQRVALGRTIVRQPKVFLLDEPLSNLDAKLRVSMRSEITKLHEKLQTTFIYVTHDQTEAMTMGSRIVVMKNGFIQQADTPITLFEDPCNLFVATFLGSPQMNIVDAELFMDGDILKAKLNDTDNLIVSFPDIKAKELADKKYIGKKVLLGIRPEHVRPNNKGNLSVFVDVVEHLGDETIIYTKMENRKEQFIIKTAFNGGMHSNEDIKVDFDMSHVYLFDAETHKAIMGIPHEDEIPVVINKNLLKMGKQELVLEKDFVDHLLDNAFDTDVKLAIRPDYVSLTRPARENELPINIINNVIKVGKQELYIDKNHLDYLLDKDFKDEIAMAIRPSAISLKEVEDSFSLKAKVLECESNKGLITVKLALDGLKETLTAKFFKAELAKTEEEAKQQEEVEEVKENEQPQEGATEAENPMFEVGQEIEIYLPCERIDIYNPESCALKIKAKFEFIDQKTDYQAVYFSLDGIDGYRALKVKNGEKVEPGKVVDLYLPYQNLNVYDQDHNRLNSREAVYENKGVVEVSEVKGQTVIKIGRNKLTYPDMKVKPGKYLINFKQDKLIPIFPYKMVKKSEAYLAARAKLREEEDKQRAEDRADRARYNQMLEEVKNDKQTYKDKKAEIRAEILKKKAQRAKLKESIMDVNVIFKNEEAEKMDNPKNVIPVYAYDEDVLGKKLLTYVQISGFEKYSSFMMSNSFSVYKLPKFNLYVPSDAFTLEPLD